MREKLLSTDSLWQKIPLASTKGTKWNQRGRKGVSKMYTVSAACRIAASCHKKITWIEIPSACANFRVGFFYLLSYCIIMYSTSVHFNSSVLSISNWFQFFFKKRVHSYLIPIKGSFCYVEMKSVAGLAAAESCSRFCYFPHAAKIGEYLADVC